ncbi:MAG: copper resistance protein B [Alphaproteobacteria bacterium]|nr:copper resistance protein B [Alphaproteobacteria bacterium]
MKMTLLISAAVLLAAPGIAVAQSSMSNMAVKGAPASVQQGAAAPPAADHSDHGQPESAVSVSAAADPHAGHAAEPRATSAPQVEAVDHSGHDMNAMAGMSEDAPVTGAAPAPAPPSDHAADAVFDPAEMARTREALRRESGAFYGSMVIFDLAEFQARKGRDGYRWAGEAWFGGDIDRLLIKTEGEGTFGEPVEDLEIQALYSRAISPFWNAHVGVRHDIVPNPSQTYAVLGIEGIAPYWFHLTGQMFFSDRGDLRARLEGSYDERITQRLILQPRAEFNISAQDMSAIGVGSGLTDFELGARLRYEIRREFAPYVGVEWSKKTGETARLARRAGEDPEAVSFVAGLRVWF